MGISPYPNLKKEIVVGLIAGMIAAVLVFALCVWESTQPAATYTSLTWACRPWWRSSNWLVSIAAFFPVGLVFGVLAAFRPETNARDD